MNEQRIDNLAAQMRKGFLEYCVLTLIQEKQLYTSDILQELRKSQMLVVEGTLYPLLNRLKNNGMLSYEWIESTQGPPRKYYTLTEEGTAYLHDLGEAWEQLKQSIETIRQGNS